MLYSFCGKLQGKISTECDIKISDLANFMKGNLVFCFVLFLVFILSILFQKKTDLQCNEQSAFSGSFQTKNYKLPESLSFFDNVHTGL